MPSLDPQRRGLGGDYVLRKDITLTTAMYIVDAGKVMIVGKDVLAPIRMRFCVEGGCFGDEASAGVEP